jgi:uncharacterized protein
MFNSESVPSINYQPSAINQDAAGRSVPAEPVRLQPSINHQPSTINHVRVQLAVSATPDNADADVLHVRASDQTMDRYHEVISASGWRLENYRRNPVIQNAHQYGDIIFTIGRAENTWVSGNALLQIWRFASNENPFAKIARDLYRGGFLQAASVGFLPLKWEDGPPGSAGTAGPGSAAAGFRRRYLEQELLEVSAVGIPANPNALTLAYAQGAIQKSDLRELYNLLSHLITAFSDPSINHQPSAINQNKVGRRGPAEPFCASSAALRRLLRSVRSINQLF